MTFSIFGAVIVYILILKFKESYSRSEEIKKNEDIDLFILLKKAISLVHFFVVLTFLLWIFIDTDNMYQYLNYNIIYIVCVSI